MNLEIGYLLLMWVMTFLIWLIGFKAINKSYINTLQKRKKIFLVVGLLGWHLYTYMIATSGVLQTYALPPRFPIFLIIPAFLFTGVFLYKNRDNKWIHQINPQTLVIYQVFRVLIETLFVFSVAKGILHPNVTIEGYNFDMVFAMTAPIIAYGVFHKKYLSSKVLLYWHYFGLLVISTIIFVFVTTIYFPSFYGYKDTIMSLDFAKYPYVVVPAFLMPSAVFMHILSIIQIKKGIVKV